ncbi:MAG: hypothetical protein DRO11_04715 [Methanobacteriota archaeon]|nr:MAG: hypothetical protein DRO11_04715 [Euryarchaeota archaeon]
MGLSRVSIVAGRNRRSNVYKSLQMIREDVEERVAGCEDVLVKPNFVSTSNQLAATHVEAARAVIEFLDELGVARVVVAESPALGSAAEGYSNYGYYSLVEDFGVELVDLEKGDFQTFWVYDANLEERIPVQVSKLVLNSDLRVSVSPPKTHDTVIVTLSLKNMVVGSIRRADKPRIHQGYRAINLSIAKLAPFVYPHLAVLDGFVGMEGRGPVSGDPVHLGAAVSSTDFLAADSTMARIMGFSPEEVGYLYYSKVMGLGRMGETEIEVVGERVESVRKRFRPHPFFREQKNWWVENPRKYLGVG